MFWGGNKITAYQLAGNLNPEQVNKELYKVVRFVCFQAGFKYLNRNERNGDNPGRGL